MRAAPIAVTLLAATLLPIAARADWPTLDRQLARDRVVPGSALERLILANQDFSLLRTEELNDRLRIPPWLRVLYRRNHPKEVYSAKDPTHGYPLVLNEIYEWMLTHQDLKPGSQGMGATPKSAAETAEQAISGFPGVPRSESMIRVNPFSPSKIISASNNIGGNGEQAIFFSTNSGASWGQTQLALRSGDAFQSDPTVEWTSDGTAWTTTIGVDASRTVLLMRSYKSTNNGATWTFDATFSTGTDNDKQMQWADHSAASPFKDNIYVTWHNGGPVFVNRRTGPGGSWGSPLQISGAETTGTGIGADIKTDSAGNVYAFWPDTGSQGIYLAKSTNGGVSYGSPLRIATTFETFELDVPADHSRLALIYTTADTYVNGGTNNVYVAWNDLSGDSGCNMVGSDPGPDVSSTCKSRIWFMRSTNGGSTWGPPVKINNQSGLNDQFFPWVSVDPTSGKVSIVYYDTVGLPRTQTNLWYQSSTDGGVTWSAPFKVTSAPTDETVSGADLGNQYGDYIGLSGFNSNFFPCWTDRRSGGPEQIWSAAIQDSGLSFFTLPPCRLIDTRNANGPLAGPALQPGAERQFALAGSCGVPADAKALSLNVTVTAPTAAGFLRLFPGDQGAPLTSTINFSAAQTRANNAVAALSQNGSGSLAVRCDSTGTVQLIVDLNGYFK